MAQSSYQQKSKTKPAQRAALQRVMAGSNAVSLMDNRSASIAQRKAQSSNTPTFQRQENRTGLPNQLKSGIEQLSGHSLDDVKVHYNSSSPAQLNAHAYAQGTAIHVAPGQEKHLPHEAWHVVQQKQGRVQPTMQMKGKVNINDDKHLEKEADVMGAKAMQLKPATTGGDVKKKPGRVNNIMQRKMDATSGFSPVHAGPNLANANMVMPSGQKPLTGSPSQAEVILTGTQPQTLAHDLRNMANWADYDTAHGNFLGLLQDPGTHNTLTRMHVINGVFFGPSAENNMVLGTAASNNSSAASHLHQVEAPIKQFFTDNVGGAPAVHYKVTPNFNGPPPYIRDRVATIGNSAHRARFRRWAEQGCPTALKCEAVFYRHDGHGGTEAKRQLENISTSIGAAQTSHTLGASVHGKRQGKKTGALAGALGAGIYGLASSAAYGALAIGGLAAAGALGGLLLGGLVGAALPNVIGALNRGDHAADVGKAGLDGIKDASDY